MPVPGGRERDGAFSSSMMQGGTLTASGRGRRKEGQHKVPERGHNLKHSDSIQPTPCKTAHVWRRMTDLRSFER